MAGLMLLIACVPAAASEFSAPQVKAAFLYNFAKFVDWPAKSFVSEHSPLILGILGEDPFSADALRSIQGKKVKGRPLEVRQVGNLQEAKDCHLLFIAESELPRLELILAALRDKQVLTISDAEHFAASGGIIGLLTVNQRIRFEINVEATGKAGLFISSQLLKLATNVFPSNGSGKQ